MKNQLTQFATSGRVLLQRLVGLRGSTPKPDEAPKKPDICDIINALADDAFRRAPLGSTITTHGAEMTVVRHRRYSLGFYGHGICIHATPAAVVCEYRDNAGVIREYEFDQSRFHLLPNTKVSHGA